MMLFEASGQRSTHAALSAHGVCAPAYPPNYRRCRVQGGADVGISEEFIGSVSVHSITQAADMRRRDNEQSNM